MIRFHRARPALRVAAAAALFAAAGCATGGTTFGAADIPRLEQEAARAPGDAEAATRLGIAYHQAGRTDDARATLGQATKGDAPPAAALFYLGLASEAAQDWAGARDAYARFLDREVDDDLRADARARMALVARNALKAQARQALDREAALADQPPTPGSIAVFPIRLEGAPPEYEPLQAALADMMVTDLQLSGSLRVLERVQVQALVDEMALTVAGYTSPETGARAGRLLKAEHVVQGALTTLGGTNVRMDAAVVATERAAAPAAISGREGSIDAIIDLEKEAVFGILGSLNVQLTASEREQINQNRTGNLLALLAYGRGLQALDRGDYSGALVEFQQAAQLDPGFGRAAQQQTDAAELQTASASPAPAAEKAAASVAEQPVVQVANVAQSMANEINPSPSTQQTSQITGDTGSGDQGQTTTTNPGTSRNPVQEAKGQEGVSSATTAQFKFKIRNPTRGGQ